MKKVANKVFLVLVALLLMMIVPTGAQEPGQVYLPFIVKDYDEPAQLQPSMLNGTIHGWTWLKEGNFTMPWSYGASVFIVGGDDTYLMTRTIGKGFYAFSNVDTSKNPYTLWGVTTVGGVIYAQATTDVYVRAENQGLINPVMSNPPNIKKNTNKQYK